MLVDHLTNVFSYWLDYVVNRLRDASATELELRQAVEILLALLQREVLDNAALLARLEERQHVIDQLQAQITALQIELRRDAVSSGRVRPAVKFIGVLLATAVTSFGGGLAARPDVLPLGGEATQQQVVRLPQVDDQLAQILRICGVDPDEQLPRIG